MIVQIILLLAGLCLVVFGADALVDGATAIARRAGVSEFIVGLLIVGFGTSMPELVVSVTGALEGYSDVAIGNVVGSNIFNSLLILGLTAMILPVGITRQNRMRDIPLALLVTFLLIFAGMSKTLFSLGASDCLSRVEGIVFLVLFAAYIIFSFKTDKPDSESESASEKTRPLWLAILMCLGGIAGLVFGGRLFVNSAVEIARMIGASEKFIAITILAAGTSLPELVTSVVAAVKGRGQLALGNILGSNVFNILLILGCSALIRPVSFAGMNLVDMGALLLSAVLIWTGVYTGRRNQIDRFDAALLLLAYLAYMGWLFVKM